MHDKILRIKQVVDLTGLPKSTVYTYLARGEFPKQVRLGPRTVGWKESDVLAWIDQRQIAQ